MSNCIRCGRQYRELPDEQGDHDCPKCGLTPEDRERQHFTDESRGVPVMPSWTGTERYPYGDRSTGEE